MPSGKTGDEVWRVCPSGFVVMHFSVPELRDALRQEG